MLNFPVIHTVYLFLVAALPTAGIVLFLKVPRARPLALILFLPGLVGVYASFIEPYQLRLETATVHVSSQRAGSSPITVGVLADIQTDRVGDYERNALDRLMTLKPDLILLPGDLFQASREERERETPAVQDLMRRLSAPGGVYFVLGESDQHGEMDRLLEGTEVRVLVNQVVRTRVRDREITIGGLELNVRKPEAERTVQLLEEFPGSEDIRLLVSHWPDSVSAVRPGSRVDLVVAGHTHGGQVVIPLFGPPVTFTRVPRHVAAGGLHDMGDGRRIYVSRGVGMERGFAPRLRFLAPPEISLLELR